MGRGRHSQRHHVIRGRAPSERARQARRGRGAGRPGRWGSGLGGEQRPVEPLFFFSPPAFCAGSLFPRDLFLSQTLQRSCPPDRPSPVHPSRNTDTMVKAGTCAPLWLLPRGPPAGPDERPWQGPCVSRFEHLGNGGGLSRPSSFM